jgi:sulfur carrier protein
MNIIINGQRQTVNAASLADLLEGLEHDAQCVATAVNGDFVARDERARYRLQDGDHIDIVAPMQGG